jgi:hypothetical protein
MFGQMIHPDVNSIVVKPGICPTHGAEGPL